jgi:hypothetical protein
MNELLKSPLEYFITYLQVDRLVWLLGCCWAGRCVCVWCIRACDKSWVVPVLVWVMLLGEIVLVQLGGLWSLWMIGIHTHTHKRNLLPLLQGHCMRDYDLHRASVHTAKACFVLANKHSIMSGMEDAMTIMQVCVVPFVWLYAFPLLLSHALSRDLVHAVWKRGPFLPLLSRLPTLLVVRLLSVPTLTLSLSFSYLLACAPAFSLRFLER